MPQPLRTGELWGGAYWPEHGQRERKWFSIKQAAQSVDSEELKRIIRGLKELALKRT
jgi:hypothetical protein